jgi:hypothetical protein
VHGGPSLGARMVNAARRRLLRPTDDGTAATAACTPQTFRRRRAAAGSRGAIHQKAGHPPERAGSPPSNSPDAVFNTIGSRSPLLDSEKSPERLARAKSSARSTVIGVPLLKSLRRNTRTASSLQLCSPLPSQRHPFPPQTADPQCGVECCSTRSPHV